MSHRHGLQPAALRPSRARLAALELDRATKETELAALSADLQQLQTRYLAAVGGFYAQLIELESASLELEIRLGLRRPMPAPEPSDDTDDADTPTHAAGCGPRGAPSNDLKRIFRDLAKTIHPDLALDEPARWRRHSLMAEANRAYAEQDEDRLRLILHTWERNPDAILGNDLEGDEQRVQRRIASIEDRLLAIDTEFADLRASAIWQLKQKIDDARRKGWDLLAEMVLEVKREAARASARLASLNRKAPAAG